MSSLDPSDSDVSFYDTRSRVQSEPSPVPSNHTEEGDSEAEHAPAPHKQRYNHFVNEQTSILQSLDVEHREDLSKHLYATWLLAQKGGSLARQRKRRSNTNPKKDDETRNPVSPQTERLADLQPDEGQRSTAHPEPAFEINRLWRAWPLPPDQVPHRSKHARSFKTALEDALLDTMLRQASKSLSTRGEQVTSDDDLAGDLCKPIIKETMLKFDKLLIGLYRSREGYSRAYDDQNEFRERTSKRLYWKKVAMLKNMKKGEVEEPESAEDEFEKDGDSGEDESVGKSSTLPSSPPKDLTDEGARLFQNRMGLLSHTAVITQASIQGWSKDALNFVGPRLSRIFPSTTCGSYIESYEGPTPHSSAPRTWGYRSSLPDFRPVNSNKSAAPPEESKLAGVTIHQSMVDAWEKQDAVEKWRAEGGGVAADGYLEEISKKRKMGGKEYKRLEEQKRRKLLVYEERKKCFNIQDK